MGQAQINVRTRACSRTSIARTRQAALTHNVRGKELNRGLGMSVMDPCTISPFSSWKQSLMLLQSRVVEVDMVKTKQIDNL